MKVQRHDGTRERTILIGMVTDKAILSRIASHWDRDLFGSPWSNLIGNWCVDYYRQYQEAPGKSIQQVYASWLEGTDDQATAKLVDRFLSSLSEEYEQGVELNSAHIIDLAGQHFNRIRLSRLVDQLQGDLDLGDTTGAEKKVRQYGRVEMGGGSRSSLFTDPNEINSYFEKEESDVLVTYPGDANYFFQSALERDGFIAWMGPEKSGKSFWLQDVAIRAMYQRRKVAFFEIGDMSERQIKNRLYARVSRHPYKSPTDRWPCKIRIPTSILPPEQGNYLPAVVQYTEKVFKLPLTRVVTKEACEEMLKYRVKSKKPYFYLSVHPNSTMTVAGIRSTLQTWAMEDGWTPDVVCVAEGSLVLTDRGLIPIEKVQRSHRLWDGRSWVGHNGSVYKGVKRVITYAGITATPDHEVWTDQGWRTIESCSRLGLRIAKTGTGRSAIRVGDCYITSNTAQNNQEWRSCLCVCKMCAMRLREVDSSRQYQERYCQRMSSLYAAKKVSHMAMASLGSGTPSMHEPEKFGMETLWRERNQILFPISIRGLLVGDRKPREKGTYTQTGNRSYRQQWSLRTRESKTIEPQAKLLAHSSASYYNDDAQIPSVISICSLCGRNTEQLFRGWDYSRTNNSEMEEVSKQARWTEAPVWDILNAGPLHCFTVQGILAHNCVDYADILAPPIGVREPRDQINTNWKQLRALSQEMHCLVVTATQADSASYEKTLLDRRNFSEDHRKLAHCTGIVGINVTGIEKELGLTRLNWIVLREGEFSSVRCVHCAGCLAIANPCIRNCM